MTTKKRILREVLGLDRELFERLRNKLSGWNVAAAEVWTRPAGFFEKYQEAKRNGYAAQFELLESFDFGIVYHKGHAVGWERLPILGPGIMGQEHLNLVPLSLQSQGAAYIALNGGRLFSPLSIHDVFRIMKQLDATTIAIFPKKKSSPSQGYDFKTPRNEELSLM